jgi:hypothetical protein
MEITEESNDVSTSKKIHMNESTNSGKSRTATSNKKWETMIKSNVDYNYDEQLRAIEIFTQQIQPYGSSPLQECMIQELQKKISGYKTQDVHKGLFNADQFVNLNDVIQLLHNSKMICFYCNSQVHVLYEIVREVNQWTLDRVNNSHGHNRDNVIIACLKCNLNRRTMYHERYAFTRQFTLVKKLDI